MIRLYHALYIIVDDILQDGALSLSVTVYANYTCVSLVLSVKRLEQHTSKLRELAKDSIAILLS